MCDVFMPTGSAASSDGFEGCASRFTYRPASSKYAFQRELVCALRWTHELPNRSRSTRI